MLFHLYNKDYFLFISIQIWEINIKLPVMKKMIIPLVLDIQTFTKKSCLILWIGVTIARLKAQVTLCNILHYISDVHLAISAKQLKAIYNTRIRDSENLSITFKKGKIRII